MSWSDLLDKLKEHNHFKLQVCTIAGSITVFIFTINCHMLTVFKKDAHRVRHVKKFCMLSVTTNLAEPHSYHCNGHLTVAGEATSRSMGSKIRLICGDIWMISPLIRQSFLLSSSTVFIFSIHTASTGPSKISHFLSGLWWGGSRQSLQTQIEQSNFNFAVCAVSVSQ